MIISFQIFMIKSFLVLLGKKRICMYIYIYMGGNIYICTLHCGKQSVHYRKNTLRRKESGFGALY